MYTQRGANKYGAKKKEFQGRSYMSKGEAGYAQQLELRRKAHEIKEITPQYRIRLDVNGYHICNYIVDFRVVMADGSVEFHEFKGYATNLWRLKWKLTEALYGKEYKLVLIKS